MENRITVVCDNCVGVMGLLGEHGFSSLVDFNGKTYLFDTGGPNLTISKNLEKLGRHPRECESILLSHGHYDHTGGLEWAVKAAGGIKIIAHKDVYCGHALWNPDDPASIRAVGLPMTQQEYENIGATFEYIDKTTQIAEDMWFVCGVKRDDAFYVQDTRLVVNREGDIVSDIITDDASILLKTPEGFVLLLGCGHAGLVNILNHVKNEIGVTTIRTVIGGTHLMAFNPEQIQTTIDMLESFDIREIGVSHCTGSKASVLLGAHFKERFSPAAAGAVYKL